MSKTLVIGSGGAGKSTFARNLGEVTATPVFHLDKLFWKPNWQESSKEEFRKKLREVYPLERWIMDGNFGGTMAERMEHADTIVFLDLPTIVCLFSVVARFLTYRNTNRPDMTEGNSERLDLDFLRWIFWYRKVNRPKVLTMIEGYRNTKSIVILKSRKEMSSFLNAASRRQLT